MHGHAVKNKDFTKRWNPESQNSIKKGSIKKDQEERKKKSKIVSKIPVW